MHITRYINDNSRIKPDKLLEKRIIASLTNFSRDKYTKREWHLSRRIDDESSLIWRGLYNLENLVGGSSDKIRIPYVILLCISNGILHTIGGNLDAKNRFETLCTGDREESRSTVRVNEILWLVGETYSF